MEEWVSLSFISGNGTTTEPREYSYTDNNLNPGIYKYQLVQIDYDGTRKEEKVLEVEVNSPPTEYALFQNYPNPFNPSTVIKYDIPENGNVELSVYDILGKKITTLVSEYKSAGSYSAVFDASGLTSGIYFYTLKTPGYTSTRKMLLVR
jgi:hypothetical protein